MIASDLARVLHAFRRMIEDRHLMRPRSSSSLAFLVIAASIGFCGGDAETVDAQGAPDSPGTITVMSQNLYIGADLTVLFTASPTQFFQRMAAVFNQVKATDFRKRAEK